MANRNVGSVVVLGSEGPVGMFTEGDLLRSIEDSAMVGDVTSFRLITSQFGVDGRDVAEIMISNKVKRLPLVRDGKIVGMVTARDLVEAFAVANLELTRQIGVGYGEPCPICSSRIDDNGLCGCGAGGD